MQKLTQTQRSDRSKEAILSAARRQFAEHGYEATTIRSVAAEAAIHPSMVMRYYGDKSTLFLAATDIDLALPDLTVVPLEQRGTVVIEHFFELWEGPAAKDRLRMLLVSAATNDVAAEQVRRILAAQMAQMVAAVAPDDHTAADRAGLIATQILGLALCRYVLRVPPVVGLDRQTIVAGVGPVIQHYLTTPLNGSTRPHKPPSGSRNAEAPPTAKRARSQSN
jgi:AcrR family transcriptional regulator